MLGTYAAFPQQTHKTVQYAFSVSNRKLQQNLLQTFQQINCEKFLLEDIAPPSTPRCTVVLELGIAEDRDFRYLDTEETNEAKKIIQKSPLQVMDFLCIIRYYRMQGETALPLRFDYYLIRITFSDKTLETQLFHERGPRHISPEDLVDFIFRKINESLSKRLLKPFDDS
ncbi:MAG: hypothetical protein QHH24_06710 [Candidatus Bathyarchaeota archaeon]|nr:hypothetical protein [Candidatus Bathyarchaeota archaeon]